MNLLLPAKYGIPNIDINLDRITEREMDVMLRTLLPNKNIAADLNISESTVATHFKNIQMKTGLLDKVHVGYFVGAKQEELFNRLVN